MKTEKVLCVDDEPSILEAYRRQLRTRFTLVTAGSGEEGLGAISKDGPFAVIVADMRMPEMDGAQFLSRAREASPDSVRIMLTGHVDVETAIEAVNFGNIFRFLTKPCPPETLSQALSAGIDQYRLIVAEKELLEQTLKGSVKVLTDILSLSQPVAFGRGTRLRRLAKEISDMLRADKAWEIEVAAMLSQVGCVTIPQETLSKVYDGAHLTPEEEEMFRAHPSVGSDLIANIPRMEAVAEMIAYQEKHFDGSGPPRGSKRGSEIPLGARILKVALDYDELTTGGMASTRAMEEIGAREGWYDATVVGALDQALRSEARYVARSVSVQGLELGMIVAEDVVSTNGTLLIGKGQEVTESLHVRLRNVSRSMGIREPIQVYAPVKEGLAAS